MSQPSQWDEMDEESRVLLAQCTHKLSKPRFNRLAYISNHVPWPSFASQILPEWMGFVIGKSAN